MKTLTRNADGSISIRSDFTQKSLSGADVPTSTQWDIQAHQVDAHRAGDPSIDAAADAPTLAQLNKDKADRAAAKAKA